MAKKPMRLPPLRVLRVRNPNKQEGNPCITVMSSVLACWASTGYASSTCSGVEQALRECMDGPKPPPKKKNNINFHLSRFQKYLEGNSKK
ncbi:mitochondrial ribosomal protein 10 [Cryphonectria parasitica EP155]|uniref:Small ribosomal subunit protein mS37 n=1 Tax=Cryphonectria parasitica (strain ATCC 38755 / EP155) TaxID=660469 RepID=A0A9P4Y1S9_CRYP1|nr:mitochondrial ribosomal protein 10 [Cryphonectria parasitica EP155]KAF3765397.1 mitochondrial ribosomal protein 10 [Cryphonectria parasitica EP155]